jgi:hypothetical protein
VRTGQVLRWWKLRSRTPEFAATSIPPSRVIQSRMARVKGVVEPSARPAAAVWEPAVFVCLELDSQWILSGRTCQGNEMGSQG